MNGWLLIHACRVLTILLLGVIVVATIVVTLEHTKSLALKHKTFRLDSFLQYPLPFLRAVRSCFAIAGIIIALTLQSTLVTICNSYSRIAPESLLYAVPPIVISMILIIYSNAKSIDLRVNLTLGLLQSIFIVFAHLWIVRLL
ncbi:MAG: hypothetical protein KDD53_01325 [Bdellovibrionales bacterium]|nr:hypothetical protein [Bdellovibrionales bacterium]